MSESESSEAHSVKTGLLELALERPAFVAPEPRGGGGGCGWWWWSSEDLRRLPLGMKKRKMNDEKNGSATSAICSILQPTHNDT